MHGLLSRLRFRSDHHWAPDRMSAYLDGDLSSARRRRMERHLGQCRECRRLRADLSLTIAALHRLAAPPGGVPAVQIAAAVRSRLTEPGG